MPIREVISIHIGRTGVQVGNECWELYCLEHGISPDGIAGQNIDPNDAIGNFFSNPETHRFRARTLFVDLEPSAIDEIRTGAYRQLFHPEQLITGKEDAANNYARGQYTVGRELVDHTLDRIRRLTDDCNNLQGFLIYHGVGGGTGSGFAALLAERLAIDYRRKTKISFTIYPGPPLQTSFLEPYNSLLNTAEQQMDYADVQFAFDNEAMYDICKSSLGVERPTVVNINPLIAQVASSVTQFLRFEGELNADLSEFQTNLVPFPGLHSMVPALAPLVTSASKSHTALDAQSITEACFHAGNQFVKSNPAVGRFMAINMMYHGASTPSEINAVISRIKAKYGDRFVDWSPNVIKAGHRITSPVVTGPDLAPVDLNVCMLSNTTAIAETWARLNHKFDLMYAKRAFVHWYVGEGLEEGEFSGARESMAFLEKEYTELTSGEPDEEDGEY
ncbi:tubulin alpha-2 chain-like [Patiria miniata]|uniref:Tubulin alpha chain n=1 Tax=Patiria miniata TaxID=46514 RepID=A0A914BPQ5_PATMI|nr:tubulin alpha-2 chain-like [Patiria miniata]